jgi:hypothetical protein
MPDLATLIDNLEKAASKVFWGYSNDRHGVEKQPVGAYAIGTAAAKRSGHKEFTEGSEGAKHRDKVADALIRSGRFKKDTDKDVINLPKYTPDMIRPETTSHGGQASKETLPQYKHNYRRLDGLQNMKKQIDNIQKKYGEHRSVSEGTAVERRVESDEPLPEKTPWDAFLGGRAVTRGPDSKPYKGKYYVGPRGGTSGRTGDPWKKISYRGGAHYVKSLQEHNQMSDIINNIRVFIEKQETPDYIKAHPGVYPKLPPKVGSSGISNDTPHHLRGDSEGFDWRQYDKAPTYRRPYPAPPKSANTPEKRLAHHISQAHKHYDKAKVDSWSPTKRSRWLAMGDDHHKIARNLSGKQYPDLDAKRKNT